MKTHTAEIDGREVLATTTDGQPPWRRYNSDGGRGYFTNERAVCTCGRVCECAGDTRCNACQAHGARREPKGTFRKRSFLRGIGP